MYIEWWEFCQEGLPSTAAALARLLHLFIESRTGCLPWICSLKPLRPSQRQFLCPPHLLLLIWPCLLRAVHKNVLSSAPGNMFCGITHNEGWLRNAIGSISEAMVARGCAAIVLAVPYQKFAAASCQSSGKCSAQAGEICKKLRQNSFNLVKKLTMPKMHVP